MYHIKSGVEQVSYSKSKNKAVYKICNYKIKMHFEIYTLKRFQFMNEKTMQVGKYIITIKTNNPSMEALQNFDKKVMKMSDSYLANHTNSTAKVA